MNTMSARQWPLKTRVTLFTLTVLLVCMWSLNLLAGRTLREQMQRIMGQQQFSTVSFIAANIDQALLQRQQALLSVATRIGPALMNDPTAMQRYLDSLRVFQSMFNAGTMVTGRDAIAMASVPFSAGRIGVNYADRDFMVAALAQGRATVGQPVLGRPLKVPLFAMAVPILDAGGKPHGAVVGLTNLAAPNFLDQIASKPYGDTGGFLLIAPQQRLVMVATNRQRVMEPLPQRGVNPGVDRLLAGHEDSAVFRNPFGQEVLTSDKGVPTAGWILAATLPTQEAFAPIASMQHQVLLATLVLSALACALTWWLLRRELAPLVGTVDELAQLAGADAPLRRLQSAKQREVGLLVNGFNRLLDTLAQREAALRVAKAEAEAANRAKSRFLAAASHDLRQPLAALTLYVDMLAQAPAPGQEKLSARLQDCTANLGTLLRDLLDVSKLDSGVVTPTVCDFSLDSLRAPLLAVHGVTAQSKGLRLVWRPSAMLVRTDPHLLQRIVGNLIANAVRFTQQGGLLVAGRRHAGKQWLEVWDTGVGVAADQTEAIFEEFRQLGDSARNRGSGLGLAIVAKSAALLGLQIRLRSRPGRGSVFAIELPMGAAAPSLPVAPRLGRPVALRIGLVEDNTQVLAAMAAVLEGMGHTVLAGTDCAQMLEQLGERAPDIVISDYRLACGATGYDVIEAARAVFGAALPALIITGETNPELIREMATKGIAVHFKPLQVDALQEFIRQAVERGAP